MVLVEHVFVGACMGVAFDVLGFVVVVVSDGDVAIACFGGEVAGPGFVVDGPGVSYPGFKEFLRLDFDGGESLVLRTVNEITTSIEVAAFMDVVIASAWLCCFCCNGQPRGCW